MEDLNFHRRIFPILRSIVGFFVRLKVNYTYDSLGRIEGTYLLLSNHVTDVDPVLVTLAARKHLYFVASEHITRMGILSALIMKLLKPIIHLKGKKGIRTTMEILKTLRGGTSVCLFPEGNRTFNGVTCEISDVTGKLAKKSGCPLVTFRLRGGYLTQPRWGTTYRRGRMHGELVHVYPPEELKGMTDDEINSAIRQDLFEDAFATQEKDNIAFKGRKLALGMESTLFMCPKCGETGGLHSDNKGIRCSCGFSAEFSPEGWLITPDGGRHTIAEYDMKQRARLEEKLKEPDGITFEDDVTVVRYNDRHRAEKRYEGHLSASLQGAVFEGKVIPADEIKGFAICGRNTMVVHIGEDMTRYEIKGGLSFSALKYMYLYKNISREE